MNIDYLREFVLLAQTGNFLEASERLFISQSTLSKHIKHIETELNVPLFNRTTRKVELSKYGSLFLPYAVRIVGIENEYTKVLLESMEEGDKKITIGTIPVMAQYRITDVIVKFRQEHPGVILDVIQSGSEELKNLLREGRCELAFIRETNYNDKEFERIEYERDRLVAVVSKNHPLAGEKQIHLNELKDEEFVLLDKTTMIYDICMDACRKSGFVPKVAFNDHKIENIIDLVSKGMGIALLMDNLALHNMHPNIAIVDILPKITTKINLCHRKGVELSLAAKHFIQCLAKFY